MDLPKEEAEARMAEKVYKDVIQTPKYGSFKFVAKAAKTAVAENNSQK